MDVSPGASFLHQLVLKLFTATPATFLISNGVDLAATGDIDAFNAVFGPGWFATVSYHL